MSDHNPSDSFDSHPESSGCSNDDFEQLDAPGSAYYHDNGDADGPDEYGQGGYDYDPDQDTEVSTTTADVGEEEAEEDRFAAGASEAEAYTHSVEPLISFGDEAEETSEVHSLQPSAPAPDTEPAIDFASSIAADIMSSVAPSTPPVSNLHTEPESADYFAEENDEPLLESDNFPDIKDVAATTAAAAAAYGLSTPPTTTYVDSTSGTSSSDFQREEKGKEIDRSLEEVPKGCCLKDIDPRIKDLIYWRDVKKTGSVFGTILLVLLSLAVFTVISVVAYLSLAVLTVTFSFVIYKKVLGAVQKSSDGHPFKSLLEKDITLNEDRLKTVIQTTIENINATIRELRHLFLVEDVVDTIKFGILLWALTYIGSWFSDMSLIIIAFILVFSVPRFYEKYQVQIDNNIGLAKVQINKYLSIIQSKVPFLKKKEKAH